MQQSSTILIVDDDPFGRDALGMVLDSYGYHLVYAANGPEGICTASEVVPDLILLDVMMPGMDGFEVCRRLRNDNVLAEVPVLMITALDDRNSRLQGIQAGADDFITKPIDSFELLTRVQGITRLNRYRHLVNQRHRFEWVLDQTVDGYVVLDEKDRIVYANPSSRRYFETVGDGKTLDGSSFIEVVQARYQCEPAMAWERWSKRPHSSEETLYLIQPQKASSPPLWLRVFILDQTSGKQSQRLLRVQDVSAHIGTQQAMWAFQSMVRHKLNTPMHGMTSCLDLLTSQPIADTDPAEISEIISWTQDAMQRLVSSVASVLRHTQVPELVQWGDNVSLSQLPEMFHQITSSLDLMHVTLIAKSGLEPPIAECRVRISQTALECVFNELLENAKKFHPNHDPSVTIDLAYTTSAGGDRAVRIAVSDNGISLSPTQLEKMWTPYYQGEPTFTGEVSGMGLGLSLVRGLLWQIGGNCAAMNRADGPGIVVEVLLPIYKPSQPEMMVPSEIIVVHT
jgi:two-component system, cell cycle response regulator